MNNFVSDGIDIVLHLKPDTLAAIRTDVLYARSKVHGKDIFSPETLCYLTTLIDSAKVAIATGLERYTRLQDVVDDWENS